MTQKATQSDSQAIPAQKASHRAYKPKKSLKSPHLQAQVLTKRAIGHSKSRISKDLGIAFNTVTSIVELNDFDRTILAEQAKSLSLIPRAIAVAHERLGKGSENMAVKVLENTIWPLNAKQTKAQDPSLVLAIQNLMGNVNVAPAQAISVVPAASTAISASESPADAPPDSNQPVINKR